MTEEYREQICAGVAQLSKQMYDAMISSYEMVEKDLPSSLTEEQKKQIFTTIFNTSFETQRRLLEATMTDVKAKVKDKDYIAKAAEEASNVRKEG